MGDIVAGSCRASYFGHELSLELSMEKGSTGFKNVRKVRSNKAGECFQAKFYVRGEGWRTLPTKPTAGEAATEYAAYLAGLIQLPPKEARRNKRRSSQVRLAPLLSLPSHHISFIVLAGGCGGQAPEAG